MDGDVPARSTVLIEAPLGRFGGGTAQRLADAGFSVIRCAGPDASPHGCPLVAGLPCPLVEAADVVVHHLPKRSGKPVVDALRRRHASTPAVIWRPPTGGAELVERVRRVSAAARGQRRLALRLDEREIVIRAASPVDAPAYRQFDTGLSDHSRRLRYLGYMPALDADRARMLTSVDFDARFALLALTADGGRVVADCRLVPAGEGTAEVAIAVADDFQGHGLGRLLLKAVLGIAADRGFKEVVADVRYDNDRMLGLLRKLGFQRRAWELGVVTLVKTL
jgi:ribosomal protein S18 acetylase RimI-like enzyme